MNPEFYGMTAAEYRELRARIGAKPFQQFWQQRATAAKRGIDWQLTFPQWWSIWQESGKYDQRGLRRGQYVMARNWDRGPYAVGNVEIQTTRENMETLRLRRQFRRCRGPRRAALIEYHDFTEALD